MSRLAGIALMVVVLYGLLVGNYETARSVDNHLSLARQLGFFGVLTIGAGVLIVSGGIDLSMGSLVGLGAVAFGTMVQRKGIPAPVAALIVLFGSSLAGLFHGLLVTKLRLQPFLVTLCGLFIYRGMARTISPMTVGLHVDKSVPDTNALEAWANWLADFMVRGTPLGVPNILLVLVVLAAIVAVVLHGTVYGRYLYAVGANEQAARYAGIATDRVKIGAYMFTATVSGLGGILFLMEYSSANPSTVGGQYELYAITGAVLGGCTLKGGEGSLPGMLLGAAVLPLLSKLCNFTPWIGSELEYTVMGTALLLGEIVNEVIRRLTRTGR
jgi:ribose transport system permease protein